MLVMLFISKQTSEQSCSKNITKDKDQFDYTSGLDTVITKNNQLFSLIYFNTICSYNFSPKIGWSATKHQEIKADLSSPFHCLLSNPIHSV